MDALSTLRVYPSISKQGVNEMTERFMGLYHRSPRCIQTLGINILIKTEHRDKKEFDNYQNKQLRKIVQHAYNHIPFYRELYKKNNIDIQKIKTKDDLEKLPIIKKEDINNNGDLFLSTKNDKSIVRHTSGTTGKTLTLRVSQNIDALDKANWMRRDLWAGYQGEWIARFVGDSPVRNCNSYPLYRKSYVLKRMIFPTYCLSLDIIPKIFQDLKKMNIKFIQCYPSAGYLLAKYLELHDTYFPIKAILYSSEPILDFQREIMEERFKTKLFGFYGQAEGVISALECEKGNLHLTMIDGICEIIKDKKQAPLGEKGFTVVTSLHNYAMPLIRYALHDYTRYKKEDCKCGITSPLIHPIETKVRDFILTPSGKIIPPPLLSFPIRQAQNIVESQFIQKTIDTVIVKIIKSEKYTSSNERILVSSLKKLLGEEVTVKIEYVEKIYQTRAYKKQFIINEMGEKYFEKAFTKEQ